MTTVLQIAVVVSDLPECEVAKKHRVLRPQDQVFDTQKSGEVIVSRPP
jgi:hypothetical protein